MNERIQKLIEEAVAKSLLEFSESNITVTIEGSIGRVVATIPTEFCEKFAELIIEDCTDICYEQADNEANKCAWKIEKWFGV
jgi:hypothetical protein